MGAEWELERRYAFYQGFYNPRAGQSLYLGDMPAEEQKQLDALLEATRWVRQITDATPEDLFPQALAEQAADFIARQAWENVSFEIISGEALLEQGHIGIYHVGRGSERAPALLKLDFNPSGDPLAPVAACLVGKGITFDSGGYSLKSSDNMLPIKSGYGRSRHGQWCLGVGDTSRPQQRVQLFLCCAEKSG